MAQPPLPKQQGLYIGLLICWQGEGTALPPCMQHAPYPGLQWLTLSGLAACRQLLHGSQGPLQGLLDTMLKAAERSPQLVAAAAVHLCGLWVQYPAQALRYLDIWERLLLYGGTSAAPQHPVHPS